VNRRKWTLDRASAKLGIHDNLISRHEKNLIKPSMKSLLKYSAYYYVSTDWLLNVKEDRRNKKIILAKILNNLDN
jgi:transcriptional regulator with XRE-family HTH domain